METKKSQTISHHKFQCASTVRSHRNVKLNVNWNHILRKKEINFRNDRRQISTEPTSGEVFVVFHKCLYPSSLCEVNWSSKVLKDQSNLSFPLQSLTHNWSLPHLWFPSFGIKTMVYVFISFKLSFINWSTWATGRVRILTSNSSSCLLVSRKTKTSCKWYSMEFQKKPLSLCFRLWAELALRLTVSRKRLSAMLLLTLGGWLNTILVFDIRHFWMLTWPSHKHVRKRVVHL